MEEVASGSEEQARGIEQIARTVHEMERVTQQRRRRRSNPAAAGQELSAQADALRHSLNHLRTMVDGGATRAAQSRIRGAEIRLEA